MERTRVSFIVTAAFLSVLLLACGKTETPTAKDQRAELPASSTAISPARVNSAAAVTPDSRPVIVTFGDSLTAGVTSPSYPEILQAILDSHGYRFRVDNQGVSGDTTTDGLARIDNVIAVHPRLVLLEFGGNDGLRGIPVESTRANLSEMIERIQSAHIPLVLLGITLPPNYGADYVKPFTAIFPELAAQYKVKLMPFLLLHVYQNQALMQADGIHPSGEGNKIVAADVFTLIAPLLKH